ncbi:hypothetical protein HDZ31DRAFT_81612 [Schizophyllum fasciatum]
MAQSTQPLPPENASMSEMLDATVAYSNPESIENERLLSAFMSPMPLLTPALARPMDDALASPAALDLDVGAEPAVKCAAVGHPYSCHCVPCNVFADHEDAPAPAPAEEDAGGRATRASSRAPSRRASTKRAKSGLSLTAPGQDRFGEGDAQERPSSSAAARHGRHRSVTTGGYRDSEQAQAAPDDTGEGNPMLRSRLHDLLNDPRGMRGTPVPVSASMPIMSTMPIRTRPAAAHSSLSSIPDAPSPRDEVPPRDASSADASTSSHQPSLRPHCLDEAPTEPTTATSHVTSDHATPRRPSAVSHASRAALALEQTQRERHRQDRAEPTPEDHVRASQPIPIQPPSRKRSDTADYACHGSLREYPAGSALMDGSFGGASYRDRDSASTPDRDVFGSPPAEAYYPPVSRKASLRRPSAAQSSGSSGSIRTHRDT